ncbi:trans-1,2-dihydrobenzene-1,2-diol dehydrogenase-like [Liolophura sinensis]|uniref:trans-1,2-dihydrobenzene-1,2-diol dehydrogenase-like n=1 Tax=Liolophura sinensis TaxID=3198878 RepID=UPI0031583AAB
MWCILAPSIQSSVYQLFIILQMWCILAPSIQSSVNQLFIILQMWCILAPSIQSSVNQLFIILQMWCTLAPSIQSSVNQLFIILQMWCILAPSNQALLISSSLSYRLVYIGTIHPEHHKLTLLFLNHGKHVLVEKPAAMNLKQLKEMTSLAKEKKLFFMEAVWSRYFPLYERLVQELASGTIGKLKLLSIQFALPLWDVPRIRDKALGGGALLDIGVYPLNIAVFLFGIPDKILTEGTMMDSGVDEAVCVIFKYNDGRMAQLNCSVAYKGVNEVVIFGTKGQIKVHEPMWCPTEMTLPSGKVTFELPKTSAKFNFHNSAGMVYEAVHVRKCIKEGKLESPYVSMDHSEYVMGLVDQIKKDIGLRYDVDD